MKTIILESIKSLASKNLNKQSGQLRIELYFRTLDKERKTKELPYDKDGNFKQEQGEEQGSTVSRKTGLRRRERDY